MGNCQAAEAATVVIQHPPGSNNRVDRIYWSVSAHEVMNSNPGHYVALVASPAAAPDNGRTPAVKQVLKLLKPDDTLLIGQVYRLISFEDVLKEFAAKKSVKLGRLLKESAGVGGGMAAAAAAGRNGAGMETKRKKNAGAGSKAEDSGGSANTELQLGSSSSGSSSFNGGGRLVRRQYHYNHGGQWRPALQSISEIGS